MIYLNDDIDGFDFNAALPLLSEQRREQALNFKHELGRKTCAMAYLLLCEGLQKEYGLTEKPVFTYGEHGKPSIVGHPDIHFNLSHCREGVICAISEQPVGVDIESIREFHDSLVHYTMNEAEQRQIENAPNAAEAFIRFWTMKEAALKLAGTGISNNLKDVITDDYDFDVVISPRRTYIYTICTLKNSLNKA
jgi:4'-phosphopantetheinyl transferase